MKQNLANRLAAGGFWAIQVAMHGVEVSRYMHERGLKVPIGDGSEIAVLSHVGVEMFQFFCNAHMDNIQMRVEMQRVPQAYDKYGRPITAEQWQALMNDHAYKRIGLWANADSSTHVSTIWTGVDTNGCARPHIFETMVVKQNEHGVPHISYKARASTIPEAIEVHKHVVRLVEAGQL
jgi:hypothetical protein